MRTRVAWATILILTVALLAPAAADYEQEIDRLASTMAGKISRAGKTRVAVVDFTDLQGRVTELGRFLAEEFSVALAGSDQGLRVVDRTHLRSLLQEHKLATTGLIDPATARQLGKIAGVEALVTATLTPLGESVRLSVKVLDTESADIIDAATGNIPKTEAIAELLGNTVATESSSGSRSLSPDPPGSPQQTVTIGGIKFDLLGCRRSGQRVRCEFLVTALEADDSLRLYAGRCGSPTSRVFDSSGNEFTAAAAYIGAQSNYCNMEHQLVAKVPLKAGWTIEGVPLQVSRFAAIDFSLATFSSIRGRRVGIAENQRLQLRSIPVSD